MEETSICAGPDGRLRDEGPEQQFHSETSEGQFHSGRSDREFQTDRSEREFHPEEGSQVLVVEDDKPLAELLRQQLEAKSYLVSVVHDGEAARDAICGGGFDLVILDLNLPKLDGVQVLRQVRPSVPRLPVLVLTARNRVEDKALALDTGADDCMVKPFSFVELHARVRALLRRSSGPVGKISQVADLVLDRELRKVERNGRRIELTTREYDLLDYLMRNAGRPVSRNRLMEEVWKLPFDPSTNVVDVYVKYVRGKVDAEGEPSLIRTIRGVGYMLAED